MNRRRALFIATATLAIGFVACCASKPQSAAERSTIPHETAPAGSRPYLNMPPRGDGPMPTRLSETGAFADVRTLTPSAGLLPYDINVSFWSDGAAKERWIALPAGTTIGFDPTAPWSFPAGTVFVKHFEMPTASGPPRRLETRLLVRDADGGVYGVTYRWRADSSDADRVDERQTESLPAPATNATPVTWTYPGRADCVTCHTPISRGVLGVNARQLSRGFSPDSINQLVAWSEANRFDHHLGTDELAKVTPLAAADDANATIEHRARSYLDANCSQCHQPGSVAGNFDARFSTPLAAQNLIDGSVLINLGLDHARVIAPHDPSRSILLSRITTTLQPMMPPLAHSTIDTAGVRLIREWIDGLPGPEVCTPPMLSPVGGLYRGSVLVTLKSDDPQAEIRYTLDGSVPTKSSSLYNEPIQVTQSTTVRARSFRDGFTRSVVAQDTYELDD